MNWKIVHNKDHYNVYINGKFYCSADTFEEAVKELEEEVVQRIIKAESASEI